MTGCMNVERGVGRHQIGDWEFLPATGELRRRTDVRRLEPRAARTLELLCEANGEVVSQERLIADVWAGRSLSDNSVAVVIGQLRKALGDDAREARLIETIPKRGYRLRRATGDPDKAPGRRRLLAIVVGLACLLLIGVGATFLTGQKAVVMAVSDVRNETGDPAYDPLARATSELIVTRLGARGFAVRRSGQGDLALASKLVMWDGDPFLAITATDRPGQVRWSLMARATTGKVPPAVEAAAADLAKQFPPETGAERLAKPAPAR